MGKGHKEKKNSPSTQMPKNGNPFFCDGANKTELFKLLSEEVIHCALEYGKELYAT